MSESEWAFLKSLAVWLSAALEPAVSPFPRPEGQSLQLPQRIEALACIFHTGSSALEQELELENTVTIFSTGGWEPLVPGSLAQCFIAADFVGNVKFKK